MSIFRKERQSNFELLRIVAMFAIVFYHTIIHGVFGGDINGIPSVELIGNTSDILKFIMLLLFFHVNSFVLITGYFQSKTEFKWKKFLSLVGIIIGYNIIVNLVLYGFNLYDFSNISIIKTIIPFFSHWFIRVYLFLYLLSPFINRLIDHLTRKEYKSLLLILFIIFSVVPTLTGTELIFNTGYQLPNFIFLYLVGAYIREYDIKKEVLNKLSINKYRLLLSVVFISCVVINYLMYRSDFTSGILMNIKNSCTWYSNIFVVIQSIAIFLFFDTINIKSKTINAVSATTLIIYVISDSELVRSILYKNKFLLYSTGNYKFIIKIFIFSIGVFVTCSLIEMLRKIIVSKCLKK